MTAQGFRTVPEAGRLFVEGERTKGRTTADLLEDGAALQRGVLGLQVRLERSLPVNEVAFLDSGAPTCLAYYRVMGLNPAENSWPSVSTTGTPLV